LISIKTLESWSYQQSNMSYSLNNNKKNFLWCFRCLIFLWTLFDDQHHLHYVSAETNIEFNLYQTPNTFIGSISTGSIINLSITSRTLTIVANITPTTTSVRNVRFWYDGVLIRSETVAPYAIAGDTSGQLAAFTKLTIKGNHTVTANAYHTNGTLLTFKHISIVIDDFAPKSTLIPSKAPTRIPSMYPTRVPSIDPTRMPSRLPPTSSNVTAPTVLSIVRIWGELRKWHKVTIAFTGPFATETDTYNNPFLSYRFNIRFIHTIKNKTYNIPGYFAADGNAAETGSTSGNQWFCHFTPDEVGLWTYTAQFVTGINISTSTTEIGTPTAFHGHTGTFVIQNTNKTGRDHRGKGRLVYVGKHHLQFAETGEWFLKVGADRYDRNLFVLYSYECNVQLSFA
jgi:hypothetical protein